MILEGEKMYLHLGNETVIRTDDIIGIFDLDKTTIYKNTREFLYNLEKNNQIITVTKEIPKSFVVCCSDTNKFKNKKIDNTKVFINQLSSNTIFKRLKFLTERTDLCE